MLVGSPLGKKKKKCAPTRKSFISFAPYLVMKVRWEKGEKTSSQVNPRASRVQSRVSSVAFALSEFREEAQLQLLATEKAEERPVRRIPSITLLV